MGRLLFDAFLLEILETENVSPRSTLVRLNTPRTQKSHDTLSAA